MSWMTNIESKARVRDMKANHTNHVWNNSNLDIYERNRYDFIIFIIKKWISKSLSQGYSGFLPRNFLNSLFRAFVNSRIRKLYLDFFENFILIFFLSKTSSEDAHNQIKELSWTNVNLYA